MLKQRSAGRDRLRFGAFEVDLVSSELYQKGKRIELQEQPFRLLAMLLERAGEMIARDDLRRALWPGDTFVDFEAGLNTAIRKLRNALGDDPARPRYIETLPRRGYRFIASTQAARAFSRALDSVAVLPFQAPGNDPNLEYLCEGITESLIAVLSEIPALKRVIARSSVYRYRETQLDLREVGRALGVRALVTGRITLRGNRLSVKVELLDTSDLRHIWGNHYDRDLSEAPRLQDEIATAIAGELQGKLSPRAKRATSRNTTDLLAYQLYLQGRYWWNKRPLRGSVEQAIEFFNQAIARDPRFVLPHVGLADSYNTLAAWESGALAPNDAFPKSLTAASHALQADPTLAEAHTSFAYAEFHFGWNWNRAQAEFQRALSLNPNYAYGRHWYSHFLIATGQIQESLSESIRIIELDPFDLIINVHLSWHHYMAREFAQALDQADRTLAMEPSFHWGHFFRGIALEQLHRPAEAIEALRKSVELSGGSTVMLSALGHAHASAGDSREAREVLHTLHETSSSRYVSSYEIALIYATLGQSEEAFDFFNRACEERSGWLPYLNAEPRVDSLRSDNRFHALAARIGLPIRPRGASVSGPGGGS
ncbi:MAG: winged helix-turn-helix domain-containing protein [Terriglobales bacterium]